MKKILVMFGLLAVILLSHSLTSTAQERTVASSNTISAADKAAIIEIFKTVDSKSYRLQFTGSRSAYGARQISSGEMERIRGIAVPADKGVVVNWKDAGVIYLRDGSIIYVAAITTTSRTSSNHLLNLLGKEKAAKLKTIMDKYVINPGLIVDPKSVVGPCN